MLEATLSGFVLAAATWPVGGTVVDEAGRPLTGARVERVGGPEATLTDAGGGFELQLPPGAAVLRASRPGYLERTLRVDVAGAIPALQLALPGAPRLDETILVETVRAAEWMPVTTAELEQAEIGRLDRGQEIPFLLAETPSLTQYSDSGSEAGYSYLYLRGIPQTRLGVTLDGVPLGDAEDGAFYWANLAGLAAATESLQVQRGVGTSSFGAPSFAGSISLASLHPEAEPQLEASYGAGSFATHRAGLGAHSGRFGPGLAAFGRVHYGESDGYRDHSGALQRSVFVGASHQGERVFLKLFGLAGTERQQLSYYAVDEPTLAAHPTENPLSPAERDRFTQRLLHAKLSWAASPDTRLDAQVYATDADGWYRIFEDLERTRLLEYGLAWHTLGGTASLSHRRGPLDLTAGAQLQGFRSTHEGGLVDAPPDYVNHGDKDEWSAFAKLGYLSGRLSAWADAQVRHARFRHEGSLDLGEVSWSFFNPRVGARFDVSAPLFVYASLGRSSREPGRADLFAGDDDPSVGYDLGAVKPERVTDLEAGVGWRSSGLRLEANVYLMEFRNEIAQTGELSEIGLPLRRNADRSYRRGVEIDAELRAGADWSFRLSANLNRSRIHSWTQFLDVYSTDGDYLTSEPRSFGDVPPLLTPPLTANASVAWTPGPLSLSLSGRRLSAAHLDNTGDATTRTPGFFDAELNARLALTRGERALRLRLDVSNLFDHDRRWPSGYSYLFLTRDAEGRDAPGGTAYYYPLSGRSVFVGVELEL